MARFKRRTVIRCTLIKRRNSNQPELLDLILDKGPRLRVMSPAPYMHAAMVGVELRFYEDAFVRIGKQPLLHVLGFVDDATGCFVKCVLVNLPKPIRVCCTHCGEFIDAKESDKDLLWYHCCYCGDSRLIFDPRKLKMSDEV